MMVRVDSEVNAMDALELEVNGEPRRVMLGPDEVLVIGRDPSCQLVVADRSVSRRHAEIRREGAGWVVRDLGSRNGIHLDGERAEEIRVTNGAEIRIGSPHDGPVLTFAVPQQRQPEPPPVTPPPGPEPAPRPAPAPEPAPHPVPAAVPEPAPRPAPAPAAEPAPAPHREPSFFEPQAPDPRASGALAPELPGSPQWAPELAAPGPRVPEPRTGGLQLPEPPEPASPAASPPVAAPSGAASQALPSQARPSQALPSQERPSQERPSQARPSQARPEIASFDVSGTVTIGRSPGNDIVLPDLLASRKHAEVRRVDGGHQLVDLGSTNGTYVNGKRVNRVMLSAGDLVSVGHFELTFDGQRLHERVDTGPVSLAAEQVCVDIGKHRIVSDVSFVLEHGSFLGVIGPSGCGKSTLIRAITGLQQASGGRVSYDGRDLYQEYADLRYRIGMVPQDDVLHRQLTVRRALRFSAALRFADDVTRRERWQRVEEVMGTLGLTRSAKQRIDKLSGGQRKRTSVALEMLTQPSVLCLDEPTSGLDPALDRDVMTELRSLADSGRTILCVTHSVLHLDYCDRVLVLCRAGTTGYFGPPDELLAFFEAEDYADVFEKVTKNPEYWTRRYRESDHYRRYVAEPLAAAQRAQEAAPQALPDQGQPGLGQPGQAQPGLGEPGLGQPGQPGVPDAAPDQLPRSGLTIGGWNVPAALPVPAPIAKVLKLGNPSIASRAKDPVGPVREFITLSLRMFTVIVADRGYLMFLLGLPLVLALLSHAVPGSNGLGIVEGLSGDERMEAMRILVVLVVGAAFIGISSAIREIVSEGPIYQRERAVGLSPMAYLAAKFVVLGVINVIQVSVFVMLSLLGRGAPDEALVLGSPTFEIIVPIAMVTTSCTMIGLCISALARSVAQTTPALVVIVMATLVLSGGLFSLEGQAVLNQISWLAPTRWGFAATASTVDILQMVSPIFEDPLWTHTFGSWWRAFTLLTVQIALFTAAARLAMRRLEPGRY